MSKRLHLYFDEHVTWKFRKIANQIVCILTLIGSKVSHKPCNYKYFHVNPGNPNFVFTCYSESVVNAKIQVFEGIHFGCSEM